MPYIYKSGLQFGINETNIYGGASYVELTQAEYDALSNAEKHNGQIYFITDGNYDFLIVNDSVPVGSIQAYGGMSAPTNWLICDGSAVSRTEYAELFQAIGITYGVGDGSTTFNLPDLRGKVAIGQSTTYELGASGGEETHTLIENELPLIDGGWQIHGQESGTIFYQTNGHASGTQLSGKYHTTSITANQKTGAYSYQNPSFSFGNDEAHNNMQPYLVTNYIIKAKNPSITSGQQLQAMELFYPVGSYFKTSDSTFDPNVEWGGTWTSESYSNDEIIEENTSGIWTYRKWKSGISECWGIYINNSVTVNAAWGTLFEGFIGNINFPANLFIATPNLLTTYYNNGVAAWIEMASEKSASQTGNIYAVRPIKTDTAYSYGVSLQAKGLWKTYSAPITYYRWHRTA